MSWKATLNVLFCGKLIPFAKVRGLPFLTVLDLQVKRHMTLKSRFCPLCCFYLVECLLSGFDGILNVTIIFKPISFYIE